MLKMSLRYDFCPHYHAIYDVNHIAYYLTVSLSYLLYSFKIDNVTWC